MSKADPAQDWLLKRAQLALNGSYAEVVSNTSLTPLEALEAMAAALGMLYRDAAEQHRQNGCVCGWAPNGLLDVLVLQRELMRHCGVDDDDELLDLVLAAPMGHG